MEKIGKPNATGVVGVSKKIKSFSNTAKTIAHEIGHLLVLYIQQL